MHLVTDTASAAVGWRLFVPESWDDITTEDPVAAVRIRTRRARSKIPEDVRHIQKWRPALDMVDEMTASWGLPADRPVVADAGYWRRHRVAAGSDHTRPDLVAVKPTTSNLPRARRIACACVHRSGGAHRCPATAKMRSRFVALRVRPANRDIPRGDDGSLPTVWLLTEWPLGKTSPPTTGCPPCPKRRR